MGKTMCFGVASHQENAHRSFVAGMEAFPPSGCEIQSVPKRGYAASKWGSCCVSWIGSSPKLEAWRLLQSFPLQYFMILPQKPRSVIVFKGSIHFGVLFWRCVLRGWGCEIGPRSVRAGGTNILRQGNKLDRTVLLPESRRTGARLTKREKIQWK